MDEVTRLVEECFSKQIGMWCRNHGVEYIGHVIEDNNQHARTGTSLGHYFRGLKWQTMAGIDDIGGQVRPGGEDNRDKNIFGIVADGEFYHYALGKLASSMAELNPNMNNNSMCEVFGNYGWTEGVQLQKYLVDHFMVRGINHFVPHAFTCKEYPDKDCPPHFYAKGNNPLYRHFGELMRYTNRVCDLIHGGNMIANVGILYHGEAEWIGDCMLMQKPARMLLDHQIDFRFIPGDVFEERSFYRTEISEKLSINGKIHDVLIVPYAEYLPNHVLEGLAELIGNGGAVYFIDGLPKNGVSECNVTKCLKGAKVITLDKLVRELEVYKNVKCEPINDRIRAMHYKGKYELLFLVNEGEEVYHGKMKLCNFPEGKEICVYDAWEDHYTKAINTNGWYEVEIEPRKSMIFIRKNETIQMKQAVLSIEDKNPLELKTFKQSVCRSIDYPAFTNMRMISNIEGYENTDKNFSGYIRYETDIDIQKNENVLLEITEAFEGVEVFINGTSMGIQIVPVYRYNLTDYVKQGRNQLIIEVATTLGRERGKRKAHTGITGKVLLYRQ